MRRFWQPGRLAERPRLRSSHSTKPSSRSRKRMALSFLLLAR
jgi:hypothetical protein